MGSLKVLLLATIYFCANSLYATEGDLYDFLWLDPDKQVYVLQNKLHKKKYSFFSEIAFGIPMNIEYQTSSILKIKSGFYFLEEWGVELSYAKYSHKENQTYKNIEYALGGEPFVRRINENVSLFVLWSPFYGKINTFNWIYYFDWSFGLGLSKINGDSNRLSAVDPNAPNQYITEKKVAISVKTELKFYLNKNFHVGFDIQNSSYNAQGPNPNLPESRFFNTDLMFALGFSF